MKKPGFGIRVSGFAFAALLLSLGASLVADATLVEAVKSGDAAAVKALLQAKADGNSAEADGTTALHWAVRRGIWQPSICC